MTRLIVTKEGFTPTITTIFPGEAMHYRNDHYADFEIRDIYTSMSGGGVCIDIKGLASLPHALRRLAELGYDLTDAHKALDEAVEEQRKRKALDEAVKAMIVPAEGKA